MDAGKENEPDAVNPTTAERKSERELQSRRYPSSQAVSAERRLGPSLQVRTRPTFSVVTSPACSKTPTCFFMPVRVMWNFEARSVIDASARPSCSRTPRLVASESAANETSKRAFTY